MKTTLEIVVALVTSLLFSGALVGVVLAGVLFASTGALLWAWRRLQRLRQR